MQQTRLYFDATAGLYYSTPLGGDPINLDEYVSGLYAEGWKLLFSFYVEEKTCVIFVWVHETHRIIKL